ncbi:MAG TPA: alpha/beta fold hydrolase [Rhodocyclaceae bacterium]
MDQSSKLPSKFSLRASDGYPLHGFVWRHAAAEVGAARPLAIINPATSVRCRYYAPFAAYLHGHGFDVISYDYRGIGESRPASLRGFKASWVDWGRLDFEAVLNHAAADFPGQPIHVVAHSIGGFIIGLAPSCQRIARIFTMGSQFAYWRDYEPRQRFGMLLKWHVLMPLVTELLGYFPAKRLGWMEDTPKGVVRNWSVSHRRFEQRWRQPAEGQRAMQHFAAVTAPILAVSASDDQFGTVAAIERLLGYYSGSPHRHVRIAPAMIGESELGHFSFFHSRFERRLWPLPLHWLRHGEVPAEFGPALLAPAERRVMGLAQ